MSRQAFSSAQASASCHQQCERRGARIVWINSDPKKKPGKARKPAGLRKGSKQPSFCERQWLSRTHDEVIQHRDIRKVQGGFECLGQQLVRA